MAPKILAAIIGLALTIDFVASQRAFSVGGNPEDLENPSGPGDYASGFFGLDLRETPAQQITDWIDPGDRYCHAYKALDCDDAVPGVGVVEASTTAWNGLTQCQRWGIRLHHQSLIKHRHVTLDVWVYYFTNIPLSKKSAIVQCLNLEELHFLGETFSETRVTTIVLTSEAFWQNIWPTDDIMGEVILGWESDAN